MSRACAMDERRDTMRRPLLVARELEQAAKFGGMAEVGDVAMPGMELHDSGLLPFRHLLQCLNWAHREGLDEVGADRAGMEDL